MKQYSEKEIISLIREKKTLRQGFEALVNKYSERLYWRIRRMLLTHEDSDDVLQNTFIKVWLNLDSFRGDSKLSTWLYRIAINESLLFIRQNKDKFTVAIDDPELEIENQLKSDPYFSGDQLDIEFQKAIKTLPDRQRQVFTMRYFDDLKYREIADVLELSEGALKASYHHAVNKIEEYIKNLD